MYNDHNPKDAGDKAKAVRTATTVIYVGGVLFAEVMFISYVSHAFESGFVALFAGLGAVLVGISSIVFLFAKDHWFADGLHEKLGYTFWAVDLIILALNTLVAFTAAGAVNANDLPILGEVIKYWKVLSPATPLMVIGMWAILRAVSPDTALQKSHNKQMAKLIREQANFLISEAQNSEEAKEILRQHARQLTVENAKAITGQEVNSVRSVNYGKPALPAPSQTMPVPMPSMSAESPVPNGNGVHPKG